MSFIATRASKIVRHTVDPKGTTLLSPVSRDAPTRPARRHIRPVTNRNMMRAILPRRDPSVIREPNVSNDVTHPRPLTYSSICTDNSSPRKSRAGQKQLGSVLSQLHSLRKKVLSHPYNVDHSDTRFENVSSDGQARIKVKSLQSAQKDYKFIRKLGDIFKRPVRGGGADGNLVGALCDIYQLCTVSTDCYDLTKVDAGMLIAFILRRVKEAESQMRNR